MMMVISDFFGTLPLMFNVIVWRCLFLSSSDCGGNTETCTTVVARVWHLFPTSPCTTWPHQDNDEDEDMSFLVLPILCRIDGMTTGDIDINVKRRSEAFA